MSSIRCPLKTNPESLPFIMKLFSEINFSVLLAFCHSDLFLSIGFFLFKNFIFKTSDNQIYEKNEIFVSENVFVLSKRLIEKKILFLEEKEKK